MSSDVPFSKAFWISGAVAMGTGLAYLLYQHYTLLRKQQNLSIQNAILSEKLIRLESDVRRLRETLLVASSSSEDIEEIFVDASDVASDDRTVTKVASEEDVQDVLARVENKMNIGGIENFRTSYETISLLADKHPEDCELQWKLAKSGFLLATEELFVNPESTRESQRPIMEKSREAAQIALKLNPQCGEAHKWMAIIIGSATQFLPAQEQIKSAYLIREHITAAIRYMPNDSLVHHMMGRWCYSVYMLSWVERKVAAALFAEPPTATVDDALKYFSKADELNPNSSVDNALYLAKCYIAKRNYKSAAKWLQEGDMMTASCRDDRKSLEEIRELLPKYISYL
ncbi:regulator of microtubule dynamics protein 1 isoform X2 [Aplysia californica]|uniref:Regulator of microtubule dynamics protein 1 isoform X2 n=1 Tax=Aplysia californica TaxID=6500 RepID=A0ABM0K664_APLCA|nr:regulator of microtubule dynamics protein 1 isoform X2 [Aplysia californica]